MRTAITVNCPVEVPPTLRSGFDIGGTFTDFAL